MMEPMLPSSVDPRAQTKITSLHPPPMRLENSFSVKLVRSEINWRVAMTADSASGMLMGVADTAASSAKMAGSIIVFKKG